MLQGLGGKVDVGRAIYIFFFGTGVARLVVVYKPKLLPLKQESVFQDSRKALMAR